MQSLRDKLLKAGLVTAEDAQRAEERTKNVPAPRPKPQPAASDASPIPQLPPMPGTKAHQRLEALKQKELDERLRSLARGAEVAREEGTRTFHFMTRKGKLRRIDLAEAQAQQLESGALAIVESPEPGQIEHVLVPAATAEAMLTLSEKSVRFWNRAGAPIGFES